jgi:hypothetical protein
VRWEQYDGLEEGGEKVRRKVFRIAVGCLSELKAVEDADLQFEADFCDGTEGHRKCVPTMLRANTNAAHYEYAVHLDQIECLMVRAEDGKGGNIYLPTNKLSDHG